MIVVSDTSAIANLAIVSHLWLLQALYSTVIIPDVVAEELAAAGDLRIQEALELDWIAVQRLADVSLAEQLQQQRGLDAGEAHAIALALELKATDLLMDERLGRREALNLGLSIIGVLGVLLAAKGQGKIAAVKPVLDDLVEQAGFRVSKQLYEKVLAASKESDAAED